MVPLLCPLGRAKKLGDEEEEDEEEMNNTRGSKKKRHYKQSSSSSSRGKDMRKFFANSAGKFRPIPLSTAATAEVKTNEEGGLGLMNRHFPTGKKCESSSSSITPPKWIYKRSARLLKHLEKKEEEKAFLPSRVKMSQESADDK